MAISLWQVKDVDLTAKIFEKGFTIQKFCGIDDEGLIVSLTVGYLDALILTQNTDYNNSIFFQKAFTNFQLSESPLKEVIKSILSKSAKIDEFTKYCKSQESRAFILEIGKKFLDVDDSHGKGEVEYRIYDFSKKFNVQVFIHEDPEDRKFVNNKYTDAIVINLFAYLENDQKKYSSLYRLNFKEINVDNFNCSNDFNKGDNEVSQDFVPISVIKVVLKELKEYYFEDESSLEALKESYTQIEEKTGDLWGFAQDYNRLLEKKVHLDRNPALS